MMPGTLSPSCCHWCCLAAGGAVPPASAAAVCAATRKLLRAVIMEHETVVEWDESPGGGRGVGRLLCISCSHIWSVAGPSQPTWAAIGADTAHVGVPRAPSSTGTEFSRADLQHRTLQPALGTPLSLTPCHLLLPVRSDQDVAAVPGA